MSAEQCGTVFLSSLNKEQTSKSKRWARHMQQGFLVTLSLSWHLVCVYSLSNRYEVMKRRREVLNNGHNAEVLFTRSLLEGRGGLESSAVLESVCGPPVAQACSSHSHPGLRHSSWRAVRAVKSM